MFGNLGFGNAESLYSFGLPKPEFLFTVWILVALLVVELAFEIWKEKYNKAVSRQHLAEIFRRRRHIG